MKLGFNINFDDFNSIVGLKKLDNRFLEFLRKKNSILYAKLIKYRNISEDASINDLEHSNLITDLASILDQFIEALFDIAQNDLALQNQQKTINPTYECKRKFVQRIDYDYFSKSYTDSLDIQQIINDLHSSLSLDIKEQKSDINWKLSCAILKWIKNKEQYQHELYLASVYCAYMVYNNSKHALFDIPRSNNPDNYIRSSRINKLKHDAYIGFNYRDCEINLDQAVHHARYCIYCHKKQKDSCAKGMIYANPDKIITEEQQKLQGCPLEQKVSEMNMVFAQGFNIGALAIIMIDNPMVALTGHRVCNDCMKACIYQKQDPVNIPLVESQIFDNVINLPYGIEIYIVFSKWNPLKIQEYLPAPNSKKNILVAGMGVAGIAVSYYLLHEGHNVTGIEKEHIESLKFNIFKPLKSWQALKTPLSQRKSQGFGGISECGITNRWDKNNLLLARLVLERRQNFTLIGSINIGKDLILEEALNGKFDHVALCIGSGKPKQLNHNDALPKGVMCGAKFLTILQQKTPYHEASDISILQIRMPAIVIGCGLSAIDSAVELLHYYVIQIEKFAKNYDPQKIITREEKQIAQEFLKDHKVISQAANDQEKIKLLQELGGVTICYRRNIKNSPAYKINHEEVEHAMAMNINFRENIEFLKFICDEFGYVKSSIFHDKKNKSQVISSRTVIVAFGTKSQEFNEIKYSFDNDVKSDIFKTHSKKISYFGDCNIKFAGSTVRAIANAKKYYKIISDNI